jgi:ectoine hydroxylase-related dioxygenase (phytanoyl-CoA dioxygenase family)
MPYKWLRAVSTDLYTGIHMDKVYFPLQQEEEQDPSTGTPKFPILTLWIPLGDMGPHQGSLVLLPGSHQSKQFEKVRASYGQSTVGPDGTTSGWLDPQVLQSLLKDPSEPMEWKGGHYRMGDVVILGLETLHQTLPNQTEYWRLSVESRWIDRQSFHS